MGGLREIGSTQSDEIGGSEAGRRGGLKQLGLEFRVEKMLRAGGEYGTGTDYGRTLTAAGDSGKSGS